MINEHFDNTIDCNEKLISNNNTDFVIHLEKYSESIKHLPNTGQQIIGNTFEIAEERYIIVYQAYKPSIAQFAVENQFFGGNDFSYKRMSWIKPNFLWMMYRCGWASKSNQERVLALFLKFDDFVEILKNATFTSFNSKYFTSNDEWKRSLKTKKVRLQWDPDHNLYGEKLERRAVQLGLKGSLLEEFGKQKIKYILDITDFVKEQKQHIDKREIDKLLVPHERVIKIENSDLKTAVGIKK